MPLILPPRYAFPRQGGVISAACWLVPDSCAESLQVTDHRPMHLALLFAICLGKQGRNRVTLFLQFLLAGLNGVAAEPV